MEDIYTKQRILVPSDEHILPNAFGGRLVSKSLIDKTTNERFGSSIDAALARDLLLVRVLLGALSGDRKLPPALRGAVGPDGATYNLHPNEDAEVGKPRARVSESDGTVQIEGSARSAKELKALLDRPLAKAGVPISVLDRSMRATRTPAPPMKIEMSIGGDAVRSIVKMAATCSRLHIATSRSKRDSIRYAAMCLRERRRRALRTSTRALLISSRNAKRWAISIT